MIKIPKSVRSLTSAVKKLKPAEAEVAKHVQFELREQKYPPIEKFYPIYSDTPDAWQADLTFLRETELLHPSKKAVKKGGRSGMGRYRKRQQEEDEEGIPPPHRKEGHHVERKKAILCLVNVNTRYAFARCTAFTPAEIDQTVENDQNNVTGEEPLVKGSMYKGEPKGKGKAPFQRGSVSTSKKVAEAFKEIERDMISTTRQIRQWASAEHQPLTGMEKTSFKINTIYCDDGSEFHGDFYKYVKGQKDIDVVYFKPSEGTKRRLGIVERFNRTLKRYLQVDWARQMRMYGDHDDIEDTLPRVLEKYNMEVRHRGAADMYRKSEGVKRLDFRVTPLGMSAPGVEENTLIPLKEQETREVDAYYKKKIHAFRKPQGQRPRIRYFLKINSSDLRKKGDKFQRRGMGNLSEPYYVGLEHTYTIPYKKGEAPHSHRPMKSKSYHLGKQQGSRGPFRVLPYDALFI